MNRSFTLTLTVGLLSLGLVLWLGVWSTVPIPALLSPTGKAKLPPNFIVILSDDIGWSDVGYHGSQVRTPNIDRLAREGIRLNQFYVQPVCSQSRSALMTGRYPFRQGLHGGVIKPYADWGLPLNEVTLAQRLQALGYRTAMIGKWHLGNHLPAYRPTHRGFDVQYGSYGGSLDYFTHYNKHTGQPDWFRNDTPVSEEGYATDLLADETIRLIETWDESKPFFIYLPFTAAHGPRAAPPQYLRMYREVFRDKNRRTYAAVITALDDAIGRILSAVHKKGLDSSTVILFSSDNGARKIFGNQPWRGGKGELYEGGVRTPTVIRAPGLLPAGEIIEEPLHIVDLYPTLVHLAGGNPSNQELLLDGENVWSVLIGETSTRREQLLYAVTTKEGALRRGPWKLVRHLRRNTTELYHLDRDPAESRNLAEQHPKITRELSAAIDTFLEQQTPALSLKSQVMKPKRKGGRKGKQAKKGKKKKKKKKKKKGETRWKV